MVASWLLENFAANQFGANIFEGSDREVGNHFQVQTDARATAWRWYRPGTTPANRPDLFRIWDRSTGTVTYSTSTIPDNGAVGWQAALIPEPPVLLAGRWYLCATQWNTERAYAQNTTSIIPPAPFPGAFGSPTGMYSNVPPGMPANWNNGAIYGVDVRLRSQNRPLTWTAVDDAIAFDTEAAYMVPANRYVLTLTNTPQWTEATVIGGVDVRRVVGFWLPVISGAQGQQGRIDSPTSQLALPGWQLMDGVLIQCYPGTTGTLQAFTVDDAN